MQEALAQGIEVDWMVFATSSGGTQAGLVLGQRVFGYRGTLLGISIDEPASALKSQVAALASDASAALGGPLAFDTADVHVEDRYCGPGYGVLTDLERKAIRLFARTEGILLDPVYTGRAAGGLMDLIHGGFFPRDSRILFWHTGGQPALFAEPYRSALSETRIAHESGAG
jgi:D-cysteine desulfhydrase